MTHYHRFAWHRTASSSIIALVLAGFVCAAPPASAIASSARFTPWVRAVAKARGSVVNIRGRKTISAQNASLNLDVGSKQVNGMGTGVVIDERGYIITNYHVIDGVKHIQVTLDNDRTLRGHLVSHDLATDIAIIKIDAGKKLPVINIGTSQDLMLAEPVVAVGNAYGYAHTITRGIISQLHRTVAINDEHTYKDLIQTDASINPGNSGGPLLNIDGEMIGLNVAVRVGAQGIGFAIPIDDVMETAAELMSVGRISNLWHGIIGETVYTNTSPAFVVKSVAKNSPAVSAGIQSGDIITFVDGKAIARSLDFHCALVGKLSETPIPLRIRRDANELSTSITLVMQNGRAWKALGMRLATIPSETFARQSALYRGGLRVVSVRANGPALKTGIRQG
ncbi:MAG: trypsin-like peptidase domain-containing protein, partial [Planctomycetes bacterium]|nr:trypsin-like peptidase domain-containing protein [Planctomycetota bacterium]